METKSFIETVAVELFNVVTRSKFFNTLKTLTEKKKKHFVINKQINILKSRVSFNVESAICQKVS